MKQIKDPIYGYIDLDDFCFPLIDSAEFQRLRNIIQTGYQSLYPSALHNRFVHSIGVYHLGKKAFECFEKNLKERKYREYDNVPWDKYKKTFMLACLLHDIGHSPFSHTGEEYYNRSTDFKEELRKHFPTSTDFHEDIKTNTGKPHEAMSAIVGLELLFDNCELNDEVFDKELFVRSIIGVNYKSEDKLIENIIIGMLNGSLIDVDKLDYLIRDSYLTGFNTMALDVDRLFSGYVISKFTDASSAVKNVPAFKRGSLSVIENVTFANDLERHWIQNNPIILYDVKLLQLAIEEYDRYMTETYSEQLDNEKSIFSKTAISSSGYIEKGINLSLLCDDDIICFLKNQNRNSVISKQFFNRSQRLKPIWKSEIEFKNLENELMGNSVARSFKNTLRAIQNNTFYINDEYKKIACDELDELEKTALKGANSKMKEFAKKLLPSQKDIVKIFNIFYEFSIRNNLENNFAMIYVTKHYESNYAKLTNENLYIEFNHDRVIKLRDALSVEAVATSEEEKTGYYYLYTSKNNLEKLKSKNLDMASLLISFISQNWNEK